MRISIILLGMLFVITAGFAESREPDKPIVFSLEAGAGFPLPPDPALFQPGGGGGLRCGYLIPAFPALSTGILWGYQLGQMQHSAQGYIGLLSVISAEITTEYRLRLSRHLDFDISGGAGYFFAFLAEQPASVSGLVWNTQAGIGVRVRPAIAIGIQCEYRSYHSFYHLFNLKLRLDLWAGGLTKSRES